MHTHKSTYHSNLLCIFLMVVHSIMVAVIYVTAKKFSQLTSPVQVTLLYKVLTVMVILPWCFTGGGVKKNLATKRIGLHFLRAIFSVFGSLFFYYGLETINVSDATALTFLEQGIVLMIGVCFFRESLSIGKVVMFLSGLMGGFLVTKPYFGEFQVGYIYVFLALLFWAGNNVSIKALGKTEGSRTQSFYCALFGVLISLFMVVKKGETVEFKAEYLQYVIILALAYFIHTLAFFKSFQSSDISLVIPFEYTKIIFTGILGYLFLSEVSDKWSFIGYFSIIAGGLYLIIEESMKERKSRRQARNSMGSYGGK